MPVHDTHGRWPYVAAAAAGPAAIGVVAARDWLAQDDRWAAWLPLPILCWHQTEEWVRPGGFLPWFNRDVLGSDADEWPLTRADGLRINVGLGWGGQLVVGLLHGRAPELQALFSAMHLANGILHVGAAISQRRSNPGVVTGALLLGPVGAAGIVRQLRDPRLPRRRVAAGAAAGAGISAALFATLRRRVRAAAGTPFAGRPSHAPRQTPNRRSG